MRGAESRLRIGGKFCVTASIANKSLAATEKIGGIKDGLMKWADLSGRLSLNAKYVIKKPVTR